MRYLLILLFCLAATGQTVIFGGGKSAAVIGPTGTTLPASCSGRVLFDLTADDGGATKGLYRCDAGTYTKIGPSVGAGEGDVTGPAASVAGEAAVYDGITGKLLKRFAGTGLGLFTSGVLSVDSGLQFNGTTKALGVFGPITSGQTSNYLGQILLNGITSGTITIQPANAAGTWSLTLPANDGDASQFLQTNGSGVTSWATPTAYSLPTASADTLGGVKVGANLTITDGVLAASAGLTNPMTTAQDIIVGGTSGAPARLGKGSEGQALKIVSGVVAWGTDSTGGTPAFSDVAAGTNTAALVVGNSGSLSATGTGAITATALSGQYIDWNASSGGTSIANKPALSYLPLGGGTLTGGLLFTDNTLDIGATGATRPRTLYLGTQLRVQATTNQQVFGASSNLTTVNYPASSGAVTVTMPNVTSTVATTAGNVATATALATARTIGNVNFDGTAAIVPETIQVVDSTDTSSSIAMFDSATGNLQPKTDAGLTYNAGTGVLTATGFAGPITGAVTGNASTATALAANGANCSSGQYARGVNASGAAEDCTAAATGDVVNSSGSGVPTGNCTLGKATYVDTATNRVYTCVATNTWSELLSTTGAAAGALTLSELPANGSNFRKWLVPDALTADLTFLYPNSVPTAGQTMAFSAPSSDVSTISWINPATAATGGSLTTSGAYGITLTATATTNATLPAGTKTLLATDGSAASLTSFPTLNQNTTGNAATATALAANGANCSSGQAPLGVNASGAAENCFAVATVASGGTLTTSGAYGITLTATGTTGVTLPTSGTLMVNPMTTAEDLIVGGASGAPGRLGKGGEGTVLKIVSGAVAWGTDSTGGSPAFSDVAAGTNANALVVGTNGSLGTSGTGTITATAVPVGGVSGMGSGVGTFLATPSSANLASAVTGETGTGALVFGTSPTFTTSVILPQGTGPTVDTAGNLAVDTTTDQLQFFGGAKRALPSIQYASFVIPAPADTDDINLMKAPYGMTILGIDAIVQGTTSVTGQIQECNSSGASCADLDSDIVADSDGAADDGSLTDSTIASGAWIRWKTTSVSGTPTFLTVTVRFRVVVD